MDAPGPGVSPPVAVAFAVVGFFALVIAGFGVTTLVTETDVIAGPGHGQIPGIVGVAAATLAFAALLWTGIRRVPPSYGVSFTVAVGVVVACVLGILVGTLIEGSEVAAAVATAGAFAVSWFALVLALAGFAAAWAGVALVRTHASRPRWPWERDDDE
ncbi:hypothetical protein [Microbacterium memoriense]|uniref:Uncharacterized protein n=1 Tax=Microbacterium memoriense TaxID=2978350 RepID=A0ABT2PB38_9MICO|nr:hypothetical protein [Microbacterium memoriense]MCT9001801.1 hypothetical protein [Microbacterium memoriense]